MSQERLDQTCRLSIGTRDAVHVPFVVGRVKYEPGSFAVHKLNPGDFVKFADDKYQEFVLCEKSEAHGILNPFLDEISSYDNVVVFLMPGIISPVRHTFDIDAEYKERQREFLEMELDEVKKEDPDCADCWKIRNNQLERD